MTVRLGGYELEHRLGEGAHGRVWRARQVHALGRPVAVKRVFAGDADAASVDRLRREVETLVGLDHPHIVKVFEVVDDGDGIAIVMQLASGGSLAERLIRRGALPADEAVAVAIPLADALASAHRRGVLHLDIKPGNVLFTSDGEPLLADFGSVRRADRSATAAVTGTDGYAAPEVAAGNAPDARADVYGLGRLLATMTSGVPLPDSLAAMIAKATAPSPDDRFANATDMAAVLRGVDLDGPRDVSDVLDQPSTPATPPTPPMPTQPTRAEPVTREFGPRPSRPEGVSSRRPSPRRVVAATAAIAAIVAVAGYATSREAPRAGTASPLTAVVDRSTVHDCGSAATPVLPAGGELLTADVDGDGCDDPVIRVGNVLERNGVRFALGEAGDVPVLGDWNCDGVATPAVWRPSSAEAHLFEGWAVAGEALAAVRVVPTASPPAPDCASERAQPSS